MQIAKLPLADAAGHILLHNVADAAGQKVVKKGTRLGKAELATLHSQGLAQVEVALLGADDLHEDEAAAHLAAAMQPPDGSLQATRAVGGRVNFHATSDGVLYVDGPRLEALNALPGVTLATRGQHALLGPSFETTQAATLKVIPYALPRDTVQRAASLAPTLLTLRPLRPSRVALLVTADEGAQARLVQQFEAPTRARLATLGSDLATVACAPQEESAIAGAVQALLATHDALIIGGQTSVMDHDDITPRALALAGAPLAFHGAPVEPGNLLALAFQAGRWILCAPGCAKSPSRNVVDLVLPRLLAGETLGPRDIGALGLGGLL